MSMLKLVVKIIKLRQEVNDVIYDSPSAGAMALEWHLSALLVRHEGLTATLLRSLLRSVINFDAPVGTCRLCTVTSTK